MITGPQIRAARSLIGWTQEELAAEAGVSVDSVKRAERSTSDPRSSTLEAIRLAVEKAGVIFLEAGDDGGSGVRFKR